MSMQSRPPPPGVESTESVEVYYDSVQSHTKSPTKDHNEDERDSGYEDNKDDLDSDMERRQRTKRTKMVVAPAIPQRNERRASRVLENLLLDLTSLDGSQDKQRTSIVVQENPHEVYLSSEEDASLSDDYDDSDLDTDMEDATTTAEGQSTSRPSSRKSQEDTARIVSFVMVGKPQIVEINIPSPTSSPKRQSTANSLASAYTTSSKRLSKRPTPLNLVPNHDDRRTSVASVTSTANTSTTLSRPPPPNYSTSYIAYKPQPPAVEPTPSSDTLPFRKSSRLATNLSSLKSSLSNHARSDDAHRLGLYTNPSASFSALPSQPVQQHAFLNMDPFEAAHRTSTDDTPPTPKTPTGISSATWRMMGGKSREAVHRTLSKARKGSMGKLNLAYTAGALQPRHHANDSRTSLAITTSVEQSDEKSIDRYSEDQEPAMLQRRSVTMPMHYMEDERRPSTSSSRNEAGQGRYQDMLRRVVAKTTAQPQSTSPTSKKGPSLRMTLGRKKSIKA